MQLEPLVTLGLYADTSLIGVDAVIYQTDGLDILGEHKELHRPYPYELKEKIQHLCQKDGKVSLKKLNDLEEEITSFHQTVAQEMFEDNRTLFPKAHVISFPGQLINLDTQKRQVLTLGNAQKLADFFACPVVTRFIQADLKAGGMGRPLFPFFVETLTRQEIRPLEFIALGGITSVVEVGPEGQLIAFDVSCGQVLMDLWAKKYFGEDMDYGGAFALRGKVSKRVLNKLLKHPFLLKKPPKSLDRDAFDQILEDINLSPEDGMATLTAFTAQTILMASKFYPTEPKLTILSGGGTNNPVLIHQIQAAKSNVKFITDLGWDNNSMEAGSYAFLAVRTLHHLPISIPETTGAEEAVLGGEVIFPNK